MTSLSAYEQRPRSGALGKTRVFLEMIKFEHTIFALPFAYLTLFLVERGWPDGATFGWITLAMVAGRTFADLGTQGDGGVLNPIDAPSISSLDDRHHTTL